MIILMFEQNKSIKKICYFKQIEELEKFWVIFSRGLNILQNVLIFLPTFKIYF